MLPLLLLLVQSPLDTPANLKPHNVEMNSTTYRGRKAIHVLAAPNPTGETVVVIPQTFKNGTIELEVAGQPAAGAPGDARGFIGLAFRAAPDAKNYECFYLRPTNGRADDQLRRNHSAQYVSEPEYPWQRLRQETPGQYESYVDLEPGVWTQVKIEVSGNKARLYVNGAAQPVLIVNGLKHPEAEGQLALWVGPGTDGYFSNLRVKAVP
jgi:hypothetical protein